VAPRRLIVVVTATAVVAAAAAIVVARDKPDATAQVTPATSVRGQAELVPSEVEFGDRLEAQVVAIVDPKRIDPYRLRVSQSFAPLTQLGPTETKVVTQGQVDEVTTTTPLACLEQACVSPSGTQHVTLSPARIVAPEGGAIRTITLRWPTLVVQGRVTKSALADGAASLRANTSPPAVSYRITPSTLAWLLTAAAALSAAAAAVLACLELLRLRATRRRPADDPLTHALALVRDAEQRPPPDRRRALDLLAQVLHGDRGAETVRDLAWSEPEPEPAQLSSVVDRLESEGRQPT
jgi:hypothetical protein